MKRVKPVYFSDHRGFLLTFGPDDDDLHRWSAQLGSDRIREILGIETFAGIRAAAGDAGVRGWMRQRLRAAMESESREPSDSTPPVPPRAGSWSGRDLGARRHVERLLETWAPEGARVLDPFAGAGLYPAIASQRDSDAFWCEIDPIQRFLSVTRFRALYREDGERRRLAEAMLAAADGFGEQLARAGAQGAVALRSIADRGEWSSAIVRDLYRAAVVSLLIDGEAVDAGTVANELRRLAHYLSSQKPMLTPPALLANDAAELGAMRPIRAEVLLTSIPSLSAPSFSQAAAEFLGVDASGELRLAMAGPVEVPRGRGTSLHLDHSLRLLRESGGGLGRAGESVIDGLAGIVETIGEPGKAAELARYFAALVRTSAAVEHQLAAAAVAILDAPDSWIAGRLIRNADAAREIFAVFGFEEVAAEATPVRKVTTAGEPVRREHRVKVLRRGARPSRKVAAGGWAAWEG